MNIKSKFLKSICSLSVLLILTGCGMCGSDFSIIASPDSMDILKKQASLLSYDDMTFANGESEMHAVTDFSLPLVLDENVQVSWLSLDEVLVTVSGSTASVNRPAGDTTVVLKATLRLKGRTVTKSMPITAAGLDFTAETPENLDSEQIDLSFTNNGATLAHDREGSLYLVNNAGDGTYEVRVRKITVSGTEDLGVIGHYDNAYDSYQNSRIDFDSTGSPYVLYAGGYAGQLFGGNSYYTFVKKFNGASWVQVGDTSVVIEKRPELAGFSIGSDDIPRVSYRNSPGGQLSVRGLNGASWDLLGPEDITTGEIWKSHIFSDSSGNVYAIYKSLSGEGSNLSLLKFDGSEWNSVGVNPLSDDGVDYFAVSTFQEKIYVVFNSGENGDRAKTVRFDGTGWVVLGPVAGFSSGSAKWLDIEISASGVPYVAYSDVSLEKRIVIKRYVNGSWEPVGGENDFQATDNSRIDMVLLPDGRISVAAFSTGTGSTELVRYSSSL